MHRATAIGAALLSVGSAWAAPSAVPGTLKTLEGIVRGLDVPSSASIAGGVQPLQSAVRAADALLRSLDPGGHSGAALEAPAKHGPAVTGLLLGTVKGFPTVAGVVPYSPAWSTPLREGDRLLAIGDHEVRADEPLDSLAARLSGKVDEKVSVKVLHLEEGRVETVEVNRAAPSGAVHARVLTGGIAYVQITSTDPAHLADFTLEVGKLRREKLIGLVLDLRGTAGGKARDAVALAEPFLGPGEVATLLTPGAADEVLRTTRAPTTQVPVVVLVDPGTRGAAEIAARALQVSRRGLVLGSDTLGQAPSYRQVQAGGAHLTVPAQVALAGGAPLTGRGLSPDIEVQVAAIPRNLAKNTSSQHLAFAKGIKWEPPREESETEKELKEVLAEEDDQDEGDEDDSAEAGHAGDSKEVDAGLEPVDPFHEYPLVKRYDPRLVRAVHLLKAANIFFGASRSGD